MKNFFFSFRFFKYVTMIQLKTGFQFLTCWANGLVFGAWFIFPHHIFFSLTSQLPASLGSLHILEDTKIEIVTHLYPLQSSKSNTTVSITSILFLFCLRMQSPCLHLCKVFTSKPHLGFYYHTLQTTQNPSGFPKPKKLNMITQCHNKPRQDQSKARVKARGRKENVWSIDNDMEKTTSDKAKDRGKQKRREGRRVVRGKRNKAGRIMMSGTMLMEAETILQTQVVIKYYCFLLVLCFLLRGQFL